MTTAHVTPDPRLESRTRRRFTAAEKIALIDQFDALPHGDKGRWLRQNGLYAAQLCTWRKERREQGEAALEPKPPGQKPKDPREVRIVAKRTGQARAAVINLAIFRALEGDFFK